MASNSHQPQRIARLTPLDDVLARIDALVEPVEPFRAELAAAHGATLAEDVVIDGPIPSTALALRDGFAVKSELTTDAGAYAPTLLATAKRVDVGEPLPPDADAVLPLDAVTNRNDAVQALAPATPGEGVLPAGGDIVAGAVLLGAGHRLGRVRIALLAALGIAAAQIRQPRVHLRRARAERDPVLDAVTECIAGAIERNGGIVIAGGDSGGLRDAVTNGGADAVVVIGGTGSGRHDASVAILASVGEVIAHGIALVPGETAAFGLVVGRPLLALPGRLDGALAAWHMLGRRVLAQLTGSQEMPRLRTGKLTQKLSSPVGLAELVPVRCEGPLATPIASGYVPLSVLAKADGWILVPSDSEGYPAHSDVVIRPWP